MVGDYLQVVTANRQVCPTISEIFFWQPVIACCFPSTVSPQRRLGRAPPTVVPTNCGATETPLRQGSWSQCVRKNESGLSMIAGCFFRALRLRRSFDD